MSTFAGFYGVHWASLADHPPRSAQSIDVGQGSMLIMHHAISVLAYIYCIFKSILYTTRALREH